PLRDDVLHLHVNVEQLVEERQAEALLALRLLAQVLVGPLGVGGEAVEAALERVAGLGQRLVEELVLAGVVLWRGGDLGAQFEDGRGTERVVLARSLHRRQVVVHRAGSWEIIHEARGWFGPVRSSTGRAASVPAAPAAPRRRAAPAARRAR